MAAAMARGWAGAEGGPDGMLFVDLDRERASALAEETGGETRQRLAELVAESDVVLLAVKPDALDVVAPEMGNTAPAILSVMAATPTERLAQAFPDTPIMRVMPNQPVEVRRGVICHPPPVAMDDDAGDAAPGPPGGAGIGVRDGRVADRGRDGRDVLRARLRRAVRRGAGHGGRGRGAGSRPCRSSSSPRPWPVRPMMLEHHTPDEIQVAVAPPGGATEAGLEAMRAEGFDRAIAAAVEASLERFR